jgi:hypothetical protein
MLCPLPRGDWVRLRRRKAKGAEDSLSVGEGADDLADRDGQFPHERWHGQDLVARRELRILCQIDDLDVVPAGEMLFAEQLDIAKGGE